MIARHGAGGRLAWREGKREMDAGREGDPLAVRTCLSLTGGRCLETAADGRRERIWRESQRVSHHSLSVLLSVCLSLHRSVCLCLYATVSILCLCVCFCVFVSVSLCASFSVCLSRSTRTHMYVTPSLCLSLCLWLSSSICLSVCLSLRLRLHL